jgi:hypothetical protein
LANSQNTGSRKSEACQLQLNTNPATTPTMPPGRLPNDAIHNLFDYLPAEKGRKLKIAVCKLCGGYKQAKGTTREEKHLLDSCPQYLEYQRAQSSKTQTKLTLPTTTRIDPIQKARLDRKLALAIYKTGRPFTLFEDPAWLDFFEEFGYKPPSKSSLSGGLLEEAFTKIEESVSYQLRLSPSLHIITDESTNICSNRIINTSTITTSGDCFYISNTEAPAGKLGAEELVQHTINTVQQITKGDLSKIASITTDTCSTMRLLWKKLESQSNTSHIFTVPCDSHGLQLIVKDLLERPSIKKYWTLASTVVNTIRNSGKQHSYLYQEQEKVYKGSRKVLVASVITRWGTQYNLLKSLDNSKEALRSFAFRDDVDFSLKPVLLQHSFWAAITELLELLEPIHTAQKMSEDNKATIGYVYSRWIAVEAHLQKFANSNRFIAADIKSYLETTPSDNIQLTGIDKKNWTRRRNKQLLDIHTAAYFLQPSNCQAPMTDSNLRQLEKLFKQYIPDFKQALQQFFEFRNHGGGFGHTAVAWGYSDTPLLFWNCQEMSSPVLASFARRLLATIGNSVPSERAFSTMNYIHSKIRNRLSTDHANKLQYIYINSRVLSKQSYHEPTENDLLQLEAEYRRFQTLD